MTDHEIVASVSMAMMAANVKQPEWLHELLYEVIHVARETHALQRNSTQTTQIQKHDDC